MRATIMKVLFCKIISLKLLFDNTDFWNLLKKLLLFIKYFFAFSLLTLIFIHRSLYFFKLIIMNKFRLKHILFPLFIILTGKKLFIICCPNFLFVKTNMLIVQGRRLTLLDLDKLLLILLLIQVL